MKRLAAVLAAVCVLGTTARAQEQPAPAPKTDSERLQELERKLAEQQAQIEDLKKNAAPPKVDEKGTVAKASEETPKLEIGFKDGFFLKGEVNGSKYEIRPRARIHLDYRAFPRAGNNPVSPHPFPEEQFVLRRARVGFYGSFGPFSFEIEVDPIRTPLPLADAWINYGQYEPLQVKVGEFRVPFGLENMVSSRFIDCVERGMTEGGGNTVAPNYRIGAMVWGKIADGLLSYYVGAWNQPQSNTVVSGEPLTAARLQSEFRGFTVGVAGYWARTGAVIPSFPGRTPGQYQFFNPVSIRGWVQAYEVDACYYIGPIWAGAEYIYASQDRRRIGADGTDGTPLITQGGMITLGWLFWGPTTPGPHGAPFKDWDLFSMDLKKKRNARNVGCELILRLEKVDMDD
ncbi:MAG: porin, partial [Planctomycetota bacterium]